MPGVLPSPRNSPLSTLAAGEDPAQVGGERRCSRFSKGRRCKEASAVLFARRVLFSLGRESAGRSASKILPRREPGFVCQLSVPSDKDLSKL